MEPSEVQAFTESYLHAYGCHIIEKEEHYLSTRLSQESDKDLVHRPFYWMYVDKMGLEPQTSTLSFCFNAEHAPEENRSELLTFGSPRFSAILRSARKKGRFVRLYEEIKTSARLWGQSYPYQPWLGINFLVSFICDRKRDEIRNLGIDLRTGEIREHFYQACLQKNWNAKLPAHRHILPQRLSIPEAVGELEYHLQGWIERQDSTWYTEAKEQLDLELEQIHTYYPDEWRMSDELHQEKKQRLRETIWQYHPRVEVEVINAGLFHIGP
ncbi:YqhG family protein [Desmospora activa]|uniref:Uncharacterized protein YqhG n=1 Tax=Desmospora activa DSM 45169 TaxID=1121389 RepID=A0A2T4Z9A5_9BACL|nr:YqhG family protein [Desmospora activa]PTM58468.1 uncharacterized protein YqhG [Desmospora activa DSM 45169]